MLIGTSALADFFNTLANGTSQQKALTISFLTLGFTRLWHVVNKRDANSSVFLNEITRNGFVWIALAIGVAQMLAAAYLPVLGPVSDTVALDAQGWTLILAGSVAPLIAAQIFKTPSLRRRCIDGDVEADPGDVAKPLP